MTEMKMVFSTLVFLIFLGWLLSSIAGTEFTLLNPVTILVLSGLMVVVIGAGNTPIAKGVAMGGVVLVLLATFFIDFPYLVTYGLWGFVISPVYLGFLFALASFAR